MNNILRYLILSYMDYEYTTSTGYQIFYGILGALSTLVAFVIFNSAGVNSLGADLIFSSLFLAVGILIFINLFKRKVTITDSVIRYSWVFKTSEIPFAEVKGFRINNKVISIESLQPTYPRIRIGDYSTISDCDGLKDWLT